VRLSVCLCPCVSACACVGVCVYVDWMLPATGHQFVTGSSKLALFGAARRQLHAYLPRDVVQVCRCCCCCCCCWRRGHYMSAPRSSRRFQYLPSSRFIPQLTEVLSTVASSFTSPQKSGRPLWRQDKYREGQRSQCTREAIFSSSTAEFMVYKPVKSCPSLSGCIP